MHLAEQMLPRICSFQCALPLYGEQKRLHVEARPSLPPNPQNLLVTPSAHVPAPLGSPQGGRPRPRDAEAGVRVVWDWGELSLPKGHLGCRETAGWGGKPARKSDGKWARPEKKVAAGFLCKEQSRGCWGAVLCGWGAGSAPCRDVLGGRCGLRDLVGQPKALILAAVPSAGRLVPLGLWQKEPPLPPELLHRGPPAAPSGWAALKPKEPSRALARCVIFHRSCKDW